jgi:two-component system, cell cycle response regulator
MVPDSNSHRTRVLIADDDDLARLTLGKALEFWGYDVVAAASGAEALQILSQDHPPRLVLLDWVMPGMTGIEVCQHVRNNPSAEYTYIVLVSGNATKKDTIQGLQAGADDYLIKPFDEDELKARVEAGKRVLDLQRQLLTAQKELEFQAYHDVLTGLWNRRAIMEFLDREIAHARRKKTSLGILLADLDQFKRINDSYGHVAGDVILREVAERLRSHLRQYDGIGRIGGEEILAVMSEIDADAASALAERMRCSVVSSPIQTATAEVPVTLSIGVAVVMCNESTDANQLLNAADEALYRAKDGGRNRVETAIPSPYLA